MASVSFPVRNCKRCGRPVPPGWRRMRGGRSERASEDDFCSPCLLEMAKHTNALRALASEIRSVDQVDAKVSKQLSEILSKESPAQVFEHDHERVQNLVNLLFQDTRVKEKLMSVILGIKR